MSDVRLERDLDVSLADLWEFVTTTDGLLQWWGHDGFTIPEHALDFTETGPWFSTMISPDGTRFKVSGHVTHVRPKTSVGFTWAWHDDADRRGAESHVTITLTELEGGRTRFTLDHRDLADDDIAQRHSQGWTSVLGRLERLFTPA